MRTLLTWLAGLFSLGAAAQAPLQTVDRVDVARYMGKWYEIASFPQHFQKGCSCTTAEYNLNTDGTVTVTNSCNKDGKRKVRTAKAKVTDPVTNAKLSVQFFWPFKGKYWIIDLNDAYSYAVVGHPSRDYLWILSRTPEMPKLQYEQILQRVAAKGYDVSKLRSTTQTCNQ
jgi:apolipoprotein D and lipocalin family protein